MIKIKRYARRESRVIYILYFPCQLFTSKPLTCWISQIVWLTPKWQQQVAAKVGLGRVPLQWRHNEHECVSNHQPHDCLLNRLFRRRSKIISKLCVTDLCEGNSPVTGEFPARRASNAENVSIWWRRRASPYWVKTVSSRHQKSLHWGMKKMVEI